MSEGTRRSTEDAIARRRLVRMLALAGSVPAVLGARLTSRTEAGEPPAEIIQPPRADGEHFMRRAFEMRRLAVERGDQPYGAVVVKDGRIVGEGASGVVVRRDPTAHGEMEAIRDACRRLGTSDLGGCEVYASSKPCPMCETACYWARVARIYYGSAITEAGPPRYPPC